MAAPWRQRYRSACSIAWPERVAVVQDLAEAGLLEVLPHHPGFEPDGELDAAPELVRGRVGGAIDIRLDDVEDLGLADESALHDLGEAGEQLVARQAVQQIEVDQHGRRRVERADEVLPLGRVDAGLPADRRIDHAVHGRRHLHQADAAQPGRGDEPGEVGGGAAAEPDHRVGAGEVGLAHDLPAERRDLDPLRILGVRHLGEQHLELPQQRLAELRPPWPRGWAGARSAPSRPGCPAHPAAGRSRRARPITSYGSIPGTGMTVVPVTSAPSARSGRRRGPAGVCEVSTVSCDRRS